MRSEIRIETASGPLTVTDLRGVLGPRVTRLPHVLRLLSENHIRSTGGRITPLLDALDAWLDGRPSGFEFTFQPNRILMHDTTCTPALADIAGLRDALAEAGHDPEILAPLLPVEVSVDHSLAVDRYATPEAFEINRSNEIRRNTERYGFLKWAAQTMETVRVNPPGTGIMHTINLEQLASVLEIGEDGRAHPDMLLGTDSHTPMINGIGVLGWGIGGLEAESVMFGQATSLAIPEVVGVHLKGCLPAGTLSTDLALEVTHQLRRIGVAGAFVEFYGPGVADLSADDRAVLANMAPEYGASTGFFAVDASTVSYLERTARPEVLIASVEPVFRAMGLWFETTEAPRFDREITIDLGTLSPLIAGPRRPQDRRPPREAVPAIEAAISRKLYHEDGGGVPDGAVGVAAITSCTNTSDPRLLIAAGLLARKARAKGLRPPFWVKTSLAPGSPSARTFLERAGLLEDLSAVGYDIVGFGCTTCIGNPGPLPDVIETALADGKAIAAILSGNRNFPGRVHPKLDLAYLASPPLVIAYALKGDVYGDVLRDPLGIDPAGSPVYLSDIWPSGSEIDAAMEAGFRASDVPQTFKVAWRSKAWDRINAPSTARFPWNPTSRNLRRPKFASFDEGSRLGSYRAHPLMVLGDDMTTDHISPAGWIDPDSEAGKWLVERGGDPKDLNVYASYRGNWEVMLRGIFTNRLARNYLARDLPPAYTQIDDGTILPVHVAAKRLLVRNSPAVILAGERYGMGSSRDWAAKGVALLGTRAVIARSFERIHRSNLIGMGVMPIEILDDFNPQSAGVTCSDRIEIDLPANRLARHLEFSVGLVRANGLREKISVRAAVETLQEVELLRCGGVLAAILGRSASAYQP